MNTRPYLKSLKGEAACFSNHYPFIQTYTSCTYAAQVYMLQVYIYICCSMHFPSFDVGGPVAQGLAPVTSPRKVGCPGFSSPGQLFFLCMWQLFTGLTALPWNRFSLAWKSPPPHLLLWWLSCQFVQENFEGFGIGMAQWASTLITTNTTNQDCYILFLSVLAIFVITSNY